MYKRQIITYALPLWFSGINRSSSTKINAVFLKFLKRYLGVPYSAHNSLVYEATKSKPLTASLCPLATERFLKLTFPKCLSGLKLDQPEPKRGLVTASTALPNFYSDNPNPIHFDPKRKRSKEKKKHFNLPKRRTRYKSTQAQKPIGRGSSTCLLYTSPSPRD